MEEVFTSKCISPDLKYIVVMFSCFVHFDQKHCFSYFCQGKWVRKIVTLIFTLYLL